jgi:hypothetical protein
MLRMMHGHRARQPQPRVRRPAAARRRVPGARRRPLRLAEPLRAGLVTSLGFGHVSALLALAHPDTFLAAVPGAGAPLRAHLSLSHDPPAAAAVVVPSAPG